MPDVLFYHLERGALETTLPDLLEKTLARGWKAVIRTGSNERAKALDAHLWSYRDETFLPHGLAGEDNDTQSRQPIWLTADDDRPNAPDVLFLVDGAIEPADALKALERCVVIFDGRDEDAVSAAREYWKTCSSAGYAVTYWKQSPEGRWTKQG